MSGLYLALDGVEGCGKSTMIKKLTRDYNFLAVREPGQTKYGEIIRDLLLRKNEGDMDPVTEMSLFMSDRRETFKKFVEPALIGNRMVISDRCFATTYAYQVCASGVEISSYTKMLEAIETVKPKVIIIDLPIEISVSRLEGKKLDRFERMNRDWHHKARQGFLRVADRVINGSHDRDRVYDNLKVAINQLGGNGYADLNGPSAI